MNNLIPVILAAGESRRMGKPKILAELAGRRFGDLIIDNLKSAGFQRILLVLGCDYDLLHPIYSKLDLDLVRNEDFQAGPLSSLKKALNFLGDPVPIMLYPVDHPLVKVDTLIRLKEVHGENPDLILIPTYKKEKGHPVVFGKGYFGPLLGASLEIGAREVVWKNLEKVLTVEINDPGVVKNINRPLDL
ncbi:MAG: nucleotidyltransferase family protein [Candidatus Wallbacteria bacterium]|nr:nucleotidyltransferase family protein [Candidatus Wallbacteria bacterium]